MGGTLSVVGTQPLPDLTVKSSAPLPGQDEGKSWWQKIKDYLSTPGPLYEEGRKAYEAVNGKVQMPGSFEGHPENIGEYVPSTAVPIAKGAKDITQGNFAKGTHEVIGGVSNALLPLAPFALAGAPALTTLRAMAGGAAGGYIGKEGGKAVGLTEDQADLAGDLGGFAGGFGAGKLSDMATPALKESATQNYKNILNPTKVTTKYQTNKIMPKLLEERPVSMTREGMAEKAGSKADAAGQEVEQAVQNLTGKMKTQPVIDGLENLRKSYQVNGVSMRPEVDSAIDQVSAQFKALGPEIDYQDAVKARRILDQAVAESGGFQGKPLSDASLANIRKAGANSLREELGNASPDLKAVNAKFHFWNTLEDVLQQTIQRKTGQAPTGLLGKIETASAMGAGLAKGGLATGGSYGAAMYVLGKVIRSTGWQSMSAAAKLHVADALSNGDFDSIPAMLALGGTVPAAKAAVDTSPR